MNYLLLLCFAAVLIILAAVPWLIPTGKPADQLRHDRLMTLCASVFIGGLGVLAVIMVTAPSWVLVLASCIWVAAILGLFVASRVARTLANRDVRKATGNDNRRALTPWIAVLWLPIALGIGYLVLSPMPAPPSEAAGLLLAAFLLWLVGPAVLVAVLLWGRRRLFDRRDYDAQRESVGLPRREHRAPAWVPDWLARWWQGGGH